jgi:hypothetical protein
MRKIILDLCGGTGAWSKPYKDAGYEVHNVTLPEYDVRNFYLKTNDKIYGILAAPPCTEFSIAKNHKIHRDLESGMEIVDACLRIIHSCNPVFWALENPAGMLTKFLGKPTFSFQPYEFGDAWTKRTLIWGRFNKPIKKFEKYTDVKPIKELYVRPGRKTASLAFNHVGNKKYIRAFDPFEVYTDDAFRAITPQGFTKAFFEANQ